MSQQINLYEERLRPRRELARGRHLALAFALVLAASVLSGLVVRQRADRVAADYAQSQAEVKQAQEKLAALGKQLAERRIDPALQAELERSRAALGMRKEVIALLDAGRLGQSEGFSGLLFGFARLSTADLWLTGFSISQGGQEIEIRGRLLDAGRLPNYVQRLSAEPVFQGRRFAALTMQSVEPDAAKADPAAAPRMPESAGRTSAPGMPRYVEFVLRSEHGGDAAAGEGKK